MFDAPEELPSVLHAALPDALRVSGRRSAWLAERQQSAMTSFLEGPAFDRAGNLHLVDIAYGRILRMSPDGGFTVVAQYDGEPNGLKVHRDGRIFVADRKRGIVVVDPATGSILPVLERIGAEGLLGPNDLVFCRNGDLYFTDQGRSGVHDPVGRVVRIAADGRVDIVLSNLPGPNGIVLSPDEHHLYVAMTRANAIWRMPRPAARRVERAGIFIQLSGGAGPDGLAVDEAGNLAIAHPGLGCVWLFTPHGEPLYRIRSCTKGRLTTNLAYGGTDRRTLFVTESATGSVLAARLPIPGSVMFSHA